MVQSLTEKIFNTKVELIRELQDLQAQEEDYMMHRQELVQQALAQVSSLDDENFRVRQHLKYVHKFKIKIHGCL